MSRSSATSGPSGRLTLDRARERIARGWPPGLTVLTGEDLFHLDAAQKDLIRHLAPSETSDYGLSIFGEDEVEVAKVVGAARSHAMFSERRVVLVRDVAALTGDAEALEAYANDPPEGSHLLVRAPKLDRKRKLHQTLARSGTVLEFHHGSRVDLAREAVALASARGLILDADAADFLLELCDEDLYRVAAELEKIRCWLGDAGDARVRRDTVRELAAVSGLLSGWEVADALLLRDTAKALAAARLLIDQGEEPIRIVGGLAWRARSMIQAKAMLEARVPSRDVITAVRAWSYSDSLLRGLERYTMSELLGFPSRLLRADRELKSTSLPNRGVLESLVRDLTGPPTDPARRA